MEPFVLAFGFACIPPSPEDEEVARRWMECAVAEFTRRGTDYTKAFLAAKQENAPRWLLKLCAKLHFESPLATAARIALTRGGIDPLTCGSEFYESLPNQMALRQEIHAAKANSPR